MVRSRKSRWIEIGELIRRLDTLVIANTAIDATDGRTPHWKVSEIAAFEERLNGLRARVGIEITRLQVDQLRAELKERMEQE